MTPLRLAPNLVEHVYRGGPRIADLRRVLLTSDHQPEEWVAATVSRFGAGTQGLARTEDGVLLRDRVANDPVTWLGAAGAAARRTGPADTGVLVKLLDAGQRLPVHVHPDREFSARHLDCPYGKTEAWYVVGSAPDAAVYLGWTEDLDPAELAARRDAQDSAWMLERMHRLPVRPGDGILVPAGTAHAIGEGVFVVEAQEPTDLSIVLEWSVTTSTRDDSHLGIGFDVAMTAVTHAALDPAALRGLTVHVAVDRTSAAPVRCLPGAAASFFRVDLLAPPESSGAGPVEAGFAVVLVLEGAGQLVSSVGRVAVERGTTLAVPAAFGAWAARGPVRMVVVRPAAAGGAA